MHIANYQVRHKFAAYTPEFYVISLGFVFNLIWEGMHSPLYNIWVKGSPIDIVKALLHCTLGDVLIIIISFWTVSLIFKSRDWILQKSVSGGFVFIAIGVIYTAFSEYHNVYQVENWVYRDIMPTVPPWEIGVTPLVQWVVVPIMVMMVTRWYIDDE